MSDPEVALEIALFTKAKEYTDLDLYFPDQAKKPPADKAAWVEVKHFRNGSVPYSLEGDGDAFYQGILQMAVHVAKGNKGVEARQRATDIVKLFWTPTNLVLPYGGVRVRISKRPVLGTGVPTDTAYVVPVSIYYELSI